MHMVAITQAMTGAREGLDWDDKRYLRAANLGDTPILSVRDDSQRPEPKKSPPIPRLIGYFGDGTAEFDRAIIFRGSGAMENDSVREILDLDRYPIDQPDAPEYRRLVAGCRRAMAADGMFNLDGFVRPAAIDRAVEELEPLMGSVSFTHQRGHNIYFKERVDGVPPDHGALQRFHTVNHTLCGDQLQDTVVRGIYEYPPITVFLAQVMNQPRLYLMDDPLARFNVLEYRAGEALNWHFDRSLFTVTLLIQPAFEGGEFEYRSDLRTDSDPNFAGVAAVLRGADRSIRVNPLAAGTLNVFAGKNTLHRITPVRGTQNRQVAVLSYYDRPGVTFDRTERIGFYGRAE